MVKFDYFTFWKTTTFASSTGHLVDKSLPMHKITFRPMLNKVILNYCCVIVPGPLFPMYISYQKTILIDMMINSGYKNDKYSTIYVDDLCRHLASHPVQCMLTPLDCHLFFGGEGSDSVGSYACPFCSNIGFTVATLQVKMIKFCQLVSNYLDVFSLRQ